MKEDLEIEFKSVVLRLLMRAAHVSWEPILKLEGDAHSLLAKMEDEKKGGES